MSDAAVAAFTRIAAVRVADEFMRTVMQLLREHAESDKKTRMRMLSGTGTTIVLMPDGDWRPGCIDWPGILGHMWLNLRTVRIRCNDDEDKCGPTVDLPDVLVIVAVRFFEPFLGRGLFGAILGRIEKWIKDERGGGDQGKRISGVMIKTTQSRLAGHLLYKRKQDWYVESCGCSMCYFCATDVPSTTRTFYHDVLLLSDTRRVAAEMADAVEAANAEGERKSKKKKKDISCEPTVHIMKRCLVGLSASPLTTDSE